MRVDFEKKIKEEKLRYLHYIEVNKGKKIFIYGAGRIAKPLLNFLREEKIEVEGFCVTNGEANKKSECGIPIWPIDNINLKNEEVIFLSGLNIRYNNEIVEILKDNGYRNYLPSTEYLRYFGEYQYNFYMNPMLEITTRIGCAVNCKYCPQSVLLKNYYQTGKEDVFMTMETFKECIDKLPRNVLIEFAGFTEPFFNKECMDMILYAKEKGFKINLFTTLLGVNRKMLEILGTIQFEEFVLHLPDEEDHSNIPITDEYLEVLKKIIQLKKPNGDEFVDYASAQGKVPKMITDIVGNSVRIFVALLDRAGNMEDENLYGKRNIPGKIQCELSKEINHNVLLPDGRVTLCAQDYGLKHILGNLKEQTYEEIIHGDKANEIVKKMDTDDTNDIICRNCSLAYEIK